MRARKKDHYWRDGWILSLISVALLSVSGWMGQKLVYEHGVGVGEPLPHSPYCPLVQNRGKQSDLLQASD